MSHYIYIIYMYVMMMYKYIYINHIVSSMYSCPLLVWYYVNVVSFMLVFIQITMLVISLMIKQHGLVGLRCFSGISKIWI